MFSFRTLKPHPTPGRRLKVNDRRRSKSLVCSPADSRTRGRRRAPAVGHVGLRPGGAAGACRRRAVSRQWLAQLGAGGGRPGAQPGGARCLRLPDDETLAAQIVKGNGRKVRAVNLGVPGNAPNHLVRAFEAGLLDRYASQSVKAVVTWIIPAQLARVTGDGSWLGSSPRYVLENGVLRHTGSFNDYRLRHPIA